MTVEYRHILVPLDGSTLAAQAVPHAQAIAARFGASVVFLQAVHNTASMGEIVDETRNLMHIDDREQQLLDAAISALEIFADEFRRLGIEAEVMVRVGDPSSTILDYALDQDIDLIVMSTHGRSGFKRLVYGSVAESVLRQATCGVLLVRSEVS